jgi:hypothetical protein
MDHEILAATALIAAGIGNIIAIMIADRYRSKPRVSGFSAADIELLTTPRHEVLAKKLAQMHGHPTFMWRKFTPLAVAYILASRS